MHVLFLHGPAAVGKHTIGSLLSPLVDMPLFHNHLVVDVVRTLFDFGSVPFVKLREELWLATFNAAAQAGQSFIFTFNPERTVEPELIERLQAAVEDHGGRVHYVALTCSDETVLHRLDSPSRAQFGKLRDRAVYESFKADGGFDFPALPEAMVEVDTDVASPAEAARMIAEAFAGASS